MEQIITEDGQLVTTLEEHIDRIGIQKAGLDYHMIAIIGPQSSGKSTLLNLLGTDHCLLSIKTTVYNPLKPHCTLNSSSK